MKEGRRDHIYIHSLFFLIFEVQKRNWLVDFSDSFTGNFTADAARDKEDNTEYC